MRPAEEGLQEERGRHRKLASRDWIQAGGGPPTQEPSKRRGSNGGQPELSEERGDLGEEGPRTEQRQAIFLHMKLRHIIRALRIEYHKTEEPLEKNLHRQEEQDRPGVTPSKREGQQEGSKTASRAESKNHTPQGPLGCPPLRPPTQTPRNGAVLGRRKDATTWLEEQGKDPGRGWTRGLPHILQAHGLESYTQGGRAPARLEGSQHREEAARQQQELGKEEEGLRAEGARPPSSEQNFSCVRLFGPS